MGKLNLCYTFVINSDSCLNNAGIFDLVFIYFFLKVDNSFLGNFLCSEIELKIHIVLFMTNII